MLSAGVAVGRRPGPGQGAAVALADADRLQGRGGRFGGGLDLLQGGGDPLALADREHHRRHAGVGGEEARPAALAAHRAVDAEQRRGAGNPVPVQRGDGGDVRGRAAEPLAPADVDGQFHLLVRLVGRPVAVAGEAGALQGQQAVAGDRPQLGCDGFDPLARVDGDGDQRQVLGEREQAVGLQAPAGAEALGAAQEDARREAAALEQVADRVREEAPPVAVVLAEVEDELERLGARRWRATHSTPPSQWPSVTASSPASSERPMLSQSMLARPASPSRWDSNIQVEKVV